MSPSHSFLTFCSQFWIGFCLPWGLSKLDPAELPKYIRVWEKRGWHHFYFWAIHLALVFPHEDLITTTLQSDPQCITLLLTSMPAYQPPSKACTASVWASMVNWTRSEPCFPIFSCPRIYHVGLNRHIINYWEFGELNEVTLQHWK